MGESGRHGVQRHALEQGIRRSDRLDHTTDLPGHRPEHDVGHGQQHPGLEIADVPGGLHALIHVLPCLGKASQVERDKREPHAAGHDAAQVARLLGEAERLGVEVVGVVQVRLD